MLVAKSLFLSRRLDRPAITLLITAAVYLVFICFRLGFHGFDPSFFITAGDRLCDPDLVSEKLIILKNSDGYDGQFYYRLALDPFTSKVSDFAVRLDTPPYRHQRILYPFIVWLGSFGHAGYVPLKWYLFGIPVFSYCAWQYLLFFHWHQFPVFSGGNPIGLPFVGLINFVLSNLALENITQGFYLGELIFVIVFTFCVVHFFSVPFGDG